MTTQPKSRVQAGVREGGQFATERRAEPDVTLGATQNWGTLGVTAGSRGLSEGSRTPWGPAQHVDHVAPGFAEVGTASHGGIKLSPERNKAVPAALRNSDGWYEEDCEANIPMWVFPDEVAAHRAAQRRGDSGAADSWADPAFVREDAARRIRDWFPDRWEKATGETVTAEQSHVRAEQEFLARHADDHVAVSVTRDEEHRGMVVVTTTVGGRRPTLGQDWQDVGQRRFLVPAAEYRSGVGAQAFVVDPERHQDITPPPAPPKPPAQRHRSASYSTSNLTGAQRARVEKDLNQRYRTDTGVYTLREIIETEGVTGKAAHVEENGSTRYYLHQREYDASSSYISLPVSKATFEALGGVPDTRTSRDLAREEYKRAQAAVAKAESSRDLRSFYADTRGKATKALEQARQRLLTARAAFDATAPDA